MTTHGIQFKQLGKAGGQHKAHHHHAASRSAASHALRGAHGHKKLSADERHEQVVQQTQKWVSQTFFGQLLKQMRDSPFKSKMFDGGTGGEAFQQMADQHLADNMARGTGHKLVDAIVRRIEAKTAYAGAGQRGGAAALGLDRGHA